MIKSYLWAGILSTSAFQVDAATFHISPSGNDAQDGSAATPFQTLQRGLQAARAVSGENKEIILKDGIYHFTQAQEISAADSGTATYPLIIRAENDGQALLSAGIALTGLTWTTHAGAIKKATLPAGIDLNAVAADGLWVSGNRAPLARYPNYDPNAKYYNGTAPDALSSSRVSGWANPTGGFIHALHHSEWGGNHWRITGKSNSSTVTYEGGWMNNRGGNIHPTYRMVENIFEELDAENEWFLNRATRELYYHPPAGLDPATAAFVLSAGKELIHLVGTSSAAPVRHVTLRGLKFAHTARTFMQTDEALMRSDWRIHRGGAVYFRFAEDCNLEDGELTELGGNAVFVDGYNRRIVCRGCYVHEIGAGAFNAVGRPEAVWNPMFDPYGTPISWATINKTDKGPKTDDYPADITFTDSLIHDIGRVEKQVAGVQISIAHKVTASRLSIYRAPRAGINISEGAFGGHLIDRCDVFDTVLETGDHGSFNSWGRDRYWSTDYSTINSRIAADPTVPSQLPLLDMLDPITIQNSRWRCDHGWDIDLDDGSSWYVIKNNLCLNGGIKLREGFYRTVENNICPSNTFHPHVWFTLSRDIVRHNIWASQYQDIQVNSWGQEVNRNFFHGGDALAYSRSKGQDANGAAGNPNYQDPATLDFTVTSGDPGLLGFVNFPMNEFGVQKVSLKALAETPDPPNVNITPDPHQTIHTLLGASVKSVGTLGEVSATGLPSMNGTLFLNVPADSDTKRLGLRNLDVILEVDGVPTNTFEQFVFAWARATPVNGSIPAKRWRSQAEQAISLPPFPGLRLRAASAQKQGTNPLPVYDGTKDYLGAWTNTGAHLQWPAVNIPKPDSYLVLIEQAMAPTAASTYQIEGLSPAPLAAETTATGGWETFTKIVLGTVSVQQGTPRNIIMRPLTAPSGAVVNLREMIIIPSSSRIDSDNDGIPDNLESALGSDPNNPGSQLPPQSTRLVMAGNTAPGFVVRRPIGQGDCHFYQVEWSDDLLAWRHDAAVLASPVVTPVDASWEELRVDTLADMDTHPRQFFRLMVYQQHIE